MEEQVVATLERHLVDNEVLAGDDMVPVGSTDRAAVLHRLCAAALVVLSRICLLDAQFDRALESSEAALRHHSTSAPALKCRNEALAAKGYQMASPGERTAFTRPTRDTQQNAAL
ncbi:hypothetical protein F1559_005095 [Cyanidiococcus yangmingshanensis]|uniref:Uncharacterized protein n=1 Tax=Cyanidiococcus yangmingshanensis TaxID=2690220 RepID=A0A7J7ISZ2_9RHOD|nr:hypothetical protein F1559_005095 [Cyanidiococcus yangmingshanensis]